MTYERAPRARKTGRGTNITDAQLSQIYAEFDVPSDQIAQNMEHRAEFIDRVKAETATELDGDAIIDRLIYQRKQGQLPRLRR